MSDDDDEMVGIPPAAKKRAALSTALKKFNLVHPHVQIKLLVYLNLNIQAILVLLLVPNLNQVLQPQNPRMNAIFMVQLLHLWKELWKMVLRTVAHLSTCNGFLKTVRLVDTYV
jgi:hypothetical protein